MDSLTQAALGAAVGEALLGRKLGWRAAAWGGFFGTLPDLDVLVTPWISGIEGLRWHRGISHSILLILLAPMLLGPFMAKRWKRYGVSNSRAMVFIFLVWGTHVLIDVFTSYGTQVWEPFDSSRVTTSNLFIIDLFFLLPLLAGILACLFHEKESRRRGVLIMTALTISSLYVIASFFMKYWAHSQLKTQLAKLHPNAEFLTASPTFSNILLWRGLARNGDDFLVFHWSALDRGPIRHFDSIPRNEGLLAPIRGRPDVETLVWFSRDWWAASNAENGVLLRNLALPEMRSNVDGTIQLRSIFRWQLDDEGRHVTPASSQDSATDEVVLSKQFDRVWRRLWGDLDAMND